MTHVTRGQKNYNMAGCGHVYQSRFKSFPVDTDEHDFQVCRHKCRSALRADGALPDVYVSPSRWRALPAFTARRAERHRKSGDQFLDRSELPSYWFGWRLWGYGFGRRLWGYWFGWGLWVWLGAMGLAGNNHDRQVLVDFRKPFVNLNPGEFFETSIQKGASVARLSEPIARCRTFTARRAERHRKSGDQFLGRSERPIIL